MFVCCAAVDSVMGSGDIDKDHRKALKRYGSTTIMVGVGDTSQKPGRIGRRRLGLPSLAVFSSVLARSFENAIQGLETRIVS